MLSEYPDTSDEHEAAARLYGEKAAHYRRLADRHRRMKALYKTAPRSLTDHCERAIRKYEDLAEEFETFSQWRRKQAESMRSK